MREGKRFRKDIFLYKIKRTYGSSYDISLDGDMRQTNGSTTVFLKDLNN